MKIYCILLLCCVNLIARAGKSYTLAATRGDIIVSSLSTDPQLAPGDTLFIPAEGRYTSVQYRHIKGDSANKIWIIWLPGSLVKAPAYFQQVSSFNVSNVVIENMRHYNFYGTHRFSYGVHDVVFKNCQWINPKGAYKDQPPIRWDDQYSPVSMVFTGKKSQTFYNITYTGCLFDGFQNVNVIEISTNWNAGGTEIRRSIGLDFAFIADTFQNIITTFPAGVNAISGTGFNCRVRQCMFKNIMGPGSVQSNHSAAILWFGSIDVSQCFQENSCAQLLRCAPRSWTGLPGYSDKNTACRAWQNIVHNNLGFSAFEFNQEIGGNRNGLNSIHIIKAKCVYNTVFRTKRNIYSGPYYGYVADNVGQDTLECSYNVIITPECDYPFDISRGYIVATVHAAPKQQTMIGNKVFKDWNRSILKDTIDYKPGAAVLLTGIPRKNYSFITTDFAGKELPGGVQAYAGAVEGENTSSKKTAAKNK